MQRVTKLTLWVMGFALVFWLSYPWPTRIIRYLQYQPEGKIWHAERDKQLNLYSSSRGIYFLGDSHMEQCEWAELFPGKQTFNRGIPGENSGMLLQRLPGLVPDSSLVFLQIGINDLLGGSGEEMVRENYATLISLLHKQQVYVVPTLIFYTKYQSEVNQKVSTLNQMLAADWNKSGIPFLDLNSKIAPQGRLLMDYSWDGLHLNAAGYAIWKEKMAPFINQYTLEPGFR